MANTIDYITCTHANFITYLEESSPKEPTFKDIFEKINVKYIELSQEIYKINEKRQELLDKIKAAQTEFKRLFGHGEIKPVIDANEDEELENLNVPETKNSDKRGRKKNIQPEESVAKIEEIVDEDIEELENVPKMKGKEVKKETKKTVKQVKPVEELVAEDEEEEEPVKVEKKKTTKVLPPPVPKKTTKKVEPQEEIQEEEVVKPTVKKTVKSVGKTSSKPTEPEQVEQVEQVEEAEPVQQVKTSTKKKITK